MSNIEKELRTLLGNADSETVNFFALYSLTLHRGDEKLAHGIASAALLSRNDFEEACEVDYDLLGRIKTVCPDWEALTWGRIITRCVLRGDQRKAATLQDLMRRRVAN